MKVNIMRGRMTESPRVLAALPCLMCHMHTSDLYVAEAHKHTHTHTFTMHKPLLWNPGCIRVNSMLCTFLVTPVAARP